MDTKKNQFLIILTSVLLSACSQVPKSFSETNHSSQQNEQKHTQKIVESESAKQKQTPELILQNALGELALNHSQVYSYEQQFAGLEASIMAGYVYEIYDRDIKVLDTEYCVDYFKAVVWMIPIQGGKLNGLADKIAHECGPDFINEMNLFLQFDEANPPHYRKTYQPKLYNRIYLTTNLVKIWTSSIVQMEKHK